MIEEGLTPIFTALGLAGAAQAGQAQAAALQAAGDLAGAQAAAQVARKAGADLQAFLMGYSSSPVQGYIRRDVSQLQATATKVFGPAMGADALVFVTEAAVMHVHDMPGQCGLAPREPRRRCPCRRRGRRQCHLVGLPARGAARLQQRCRPGQSLPLHAVPARRKRQQPRAQRPLRGGPDRAHARAPRRLP